VLSERLSTYFYKSYTLVFNSNLALAVRVSLLSLFCNLLICSSKSDIEPFWYGFSFLLAIKSSKAALSFNLAFLSSSVKFKFFKSLSTLLNWFS